MIENEQSTAGASRRFAVRWVFGAWSDSLRRELVAFWLREGALTSADEAWRRTFEVACVLEDVHTGKLAGVCTIGIHLDEQQRSYGFVRIFIRPDDRMIGLGRRLMARMIEGFTALASEPGAPQRLVATIENRKLQRRGAQRLLAQLGFAQVGVAPNGELVMQRSLRAQA